MMAFFRRRSPQISDPRPAIAEFWAFWAAHRDDVISAVADVRADELRALLRPAVAAIDERLEWEVARGTTKRFTLVVSSADGPTLRALAERWLLASPDDPDVEFAATRRRDLEAFESTVLKIDDYDIHLGELVAGTHVDHTTGKLDVVVHHPLYPLLEETHRIQVGFLGLDAALGEDDVERWLGTVEVSADAPVDAIPVATLGAVVDQLRPSADQWAALQGQGPTGPVFALVRRPFGRVDRPLADLHVRIVLEYPANANGMPSDPDVAVEAEQFEERALDAIGGDGPHAVHIGHVTGGGEVVIHFYVDELEVDPAALEPVVRGWKRGRSEMSVTPDPDWSGVSPFLT